MFAAHINQGIKSPMRCVDVAAIFLQQTNGVVRVVDLLSVSLPAPISRPTPAKAVRAPAASRNQGLGLFSQLLDNLKGEYRNHAIGAAVALVGYAALQVHRRYVAQHALAA